MQNITQTPYKIGITGTIASGKSFVGQVLAEAGVPVLDTDDVVASLYQGDPRVCHGIAARFGPAVLAPDGSINKQALGAIVFNDPQARHELESLVHPVVKDEVRAFFARHAATVPVVAVLVPKLLEAGSQPMYDAIWTVVVEPEDALITRLMARSGITEEEARRRLAAQWPQAQKRAAASVVIDNSGTRDDTRAQVLAALADIRQQVAP